MSNQRMARLADKLAQGKDILIMVVGDSITWGQNYCTADETYCAELARHFARRFPQTTVLRYDGEVVSEALPLAGYEGPVTVQSAGPRTLTLVRSGVGGNTVARALKRSNDYTGAFLTGQMPDLFLLMFGINDALHDPNKFVVPEVFYDHYRQLIDLLHRENPGAELVLMTPTYNDAGDSTESCLAPYVEVVKQLAAECGLLLIDTHALWMEHLIVGSERYGQRDWLGGAQCDSCHFSPTGSAATAAYIFEQLSK